MEDFTFTTDFNPNKGKKQKKSKKKSNNNDDLFGNIAKNIGGRESNNELNRQNKMKEADVDVIDDDHQRAAEIIKNLAEN